MKKLILALPIVFALGACTTDQKQTAKDVAAAGLDAVCQNLSAADMYFQSQVVPRNINQTAQDAERVAVATIQSYCDNQPVTGAAGALKVAAAALAKIASLAQ
jgi:hypothetical protein